MVSPLSTEQLFERLERRVLGPEGQGHRAFLLSEVQIENRRADALSIGLWGSRGHHVEGFELKTNRDDWLREFEDHQKAEPCMAVCDRFWLVANPGIVRPGELPPSWGMLESAGRRRHLRVVVEAPLLRENVEHPVTREVLAGLLRRVQVLGAIDRDEIRKAAYEEGRASVERDTEALEHRLERAEERATEHDKAWEAFTQKAGLHFWSWLPKAENLALLGEIANAIREGDHGLARLTRKLENSEKLAGSIGTRLRSARQKIGDRPVTKSDVF